MRRTALFLLLSLVVLLLLPASAYAQVDYATATLKGTVFDPQSLLVTGATITVKNPNTGLTRTVETGTDGEYLIPLLPPGAYNLEVQARGFATTKMTVELNLGQVATYDVHLRVGAQSETLEVTEQAELVQVQQTQQANTLGLREISELPNVTRSFTDSIFTLPGVSRSEAPRAQNPGFSGFQSSGFSIGGSNGRNNLVTLDGGEGDYGSGQLRTPHVPLDSIQEFQVNRSSFAAEFGFTIGTAINLVTKGGTNAFHGSAYAYYRNQSTSAANYFAPRTASKATDSNFVPGVTIGGPIIKDKLFFFSAFEYMKQDTPQFRSYSTSEAALGIDSNPSQRAYVNGMLTSGNPVLQAVGGQLNYALNPANYASSAAMLARNSGAFNDWKKFHNWVTRLDYQPSTSDTFTGRFSFMRDNASRMYILDPLNAPDAATIQYWDDWTIMGNWNHVFNPRFLNQLRVQAVPSDVADVHVASPHTAYLRIGSLGNFGGDHYEPYYARQRRFQFEDSLSYTRGNHSMKFGGSYRPVSYYVHDELWFGGEFQFNDGAVPIVGVMVPQTSPAFATVMGYTAQWCAAKGLATATTPMSAIPTCDPSTNLSAMQTFNIGVPAAFRQGFGNPNWQDWGHYLGFYAQDTWRLTHNFTLDFGGRVDYDREPAPLPHHTWFSPRLGFAWNPDGNGKTVIRGGGGMFVAPVNFFIGYIVNLLDDSGRYINQVASILTPTDKTVASIWGYGLATGKLPFSQLTATDMTNLGFNIGPGQPNRIVLQPSPDYKNAYSLQGSLAVQHALTQRTAFEVAYHMYRGVHLQLARDGNVQETGVIDPFVGPIYTRIDPNLVQREVYSSIGNSIYHGVTTSLTHRSRPLQFQASYTFSRSIDDNIDFNNDFMPFRPTRMKMERGLSTFNIKHNFVASAVYSTPFQAGSGNFLARALADITLSPVVSLRSGIPFTIRVPGMQNGTLGENLYARPWSAGRNTGLGPNYYAADLRFTKSIYIRRDAGVKVDFLVEGTNILNHTNFAAVNDVFPADPNPFSLGPYTVNLLNGPYRFRGSKLLDRSQPLGFKAAFDPRQVQFGLKFIF